MIYVSDQTFMDYMQWEGKEKFLTFLNQPKWTLEGKIPEAKQKKLSFRDLVYLSLQKTLHEYGIKKENLTSLKKSFYQEKQDDTQEDTESMFTSEVAIGCVFMGIEIILCCSLSGEATFYDPTNFALLRNPNIGSFIFVSLAYLINECLVEIKKDPIELTVSMQNLLG